MTTDEAKMLRIWWVYSQGYAFTFIMKFETRSVLCSLFFLLMWTQIFFTHLLLFNAKFYMDQILNNLAADEYFSGYVCRACCASLSPCAPWVPGSEAHGWFCGLGWCSFAGLGLRVCHWNQVPLVRARTKAACLCLQCVM